MPFCSIVFKLNSKKIFLQNFIGAPKMLNAFWYDVNVFKEAKKLYKKISKKIKGEKSNSNYRNNGIMKDWIAQ